MARRFCWVWLFLAATALSSCASSITADTEDLMSPRLLHHHDEMDLDGGEKCQALFEATRYPDALPDGITLTAFL